MKHLLRTLPLIAALTASASAQTVYFWDVNGATNGFGNNPRNGTWGTDLFWTTNSAGTSATVAWPGLVRPSTPDIARFDGGNGTITVSGTQAAFAVRVTSAGNYTLTGGTINLETGNFNTGIAAGGTYNGDTNVQMTIDSALTLGADGGTGTRELIIAAGGTGTTRGGNTLTINGGISAGTGARATTQLLQFRPSMPAGETASKIVINGVISNGSQTVSTEFGTRAAGDTSGRVEVRGLNTYSGTTRIGSGTIAFYNDATNSANGAFGNNANAIDIGFGQVLSTSQVTLVANGARTVSKAINIQDGASTATTYAVTIGGETADTSTFSGNIDLDGTTARTTKVTLTAAGGGRVNFTGLLSHGTAGSSVPIEIAGGGTVNLGRTAGNTYTGGTTVLSNSTLLVNNTSNSGTGTGSLTVNSGAVLGGSGFIGGATTISGSLRPGNSIGTLTVSNNVTWNIGDNWVFELGAGNTSDLLNITGDFLKGTTNGSAFTFDFAGATQTGTFKLVDWSGSTTFATNDFGYVNLGSGYSGTFALNGSQLEFTAVPEPSTYAMLALAGAGFGAHVLRRRRSRH